MNGDYGQQRSSDKVPTRTGHRVVSFSVILNPICFSYQDGTSTATKVSWLTALVRMEDCGDASNGPASKALKILRYISDFGVHGSNVSNISPHCFGPRHSNSGPKPPKLSVIPHRPEVAFWERTWVSSGSITIQAVKFLPFFIELWELSNKS